MEWSGNQGLGSIIQRILAIALAVAVFATFGFAHGRQGEITQIYTIWLVDSRENAQKVLEKG